MAAKDHDTTCDYLVKHAACTCGATPPEPAELTADGEATRPKPATAEPTSAKS